MVLAYSDISEMAWQQLKIQKCDVALKLKLSSLN